MASTHALSPEGSLAHLAAAITPPLTADEIRALTEPLNSWEKRRKADDVDIDAILEDPHLNRSGRIMRTVVGTLRALGYDVAWLTGVTGLTAVELDPPRRTLVPTEHLHTILTVAARIGDRPATPESIGLTADRIEAVRRGAREQHYFVPACYDEQYTYVPGSSRDAERSGSVTTAAHVANKIRGAAYFMRKGGSSGQIAREHGFNTRTWSRIVSELGIRSVRRGAAQATVVLPAPGQDALRRVIIDAERDLDMGADPADLWAQLRRDAEVIKGQVEDAAALAAAGVQEDVAA